MKKIDFAELTKLPLYSTLYLIEGAIHNSFKIVGYDSDLKCGVYIVNRNLYDDVRFITPRDFSDEFRNRPKTFLIGEWDNVIVRELMIKHLINEIDIIKDIYI